MNKQSLLEHILAALESAYTVAADAAKQAHDTATHEENVAENKYDTLGLEASYLAQGQAQRVSECEADLAVFKNLDAKVFSETMPIALGALVKLRDEENVEQLLFLGPSAGGLKLTFYQDVITLITPSAPLGKLLVGRFVDDEIEISLGNKKQCYEISSVY